MGISVYVQRQISLAERYHREDTKGSSIHDQDLLVLKS